MTSETCGHPKCLDYIFLECLNRLILYEMVASHSVNLLLFELLCSICTYIVSEIFEIVYTSVYAHGD